MNDAQCRTHGILKMENESMNMHDCVLCPRNCHADRIAGQTGYCGQTNDIRAARAALHMWEEPCISGQTGSGTVFFSGCNMGCVFCQNRSISQGNTGKPVSSERLAEIFLTLQSQKALNINLVTPTHFIPQIISALQTAKAKGLSIPIVYNTGTYEKPEIIRQLDGLVDIYLPDLKYYSSTLSKKYSAAEDYFQFASLSLTEMLRQTGRPVFQESNDSSPMLRGVIVRHLTLPGCTSDSINILDYLYHNFGNDIYVSLMNQYTPTSFIIEQNQYKELMRSLTHREYDKIVNYAISLGIINGFIQENGTVSESFIPQFDCSGI